MRSRTLTPTSVPISASTSAEASSTTASVAGLGAELVAAVIECLDHPVVRDRSARQVIQTVKPPVGVFERERLLERFLRDARDVEARVSRSRRQLVGQVNVHSCHAHIIHTSFGRVQVAARASGPAPAPTRSRSATPHPPSAPPRPATTSPSASSPRPHKPPPSHLLLRLPARPSQSSPCSPTDVVLNCILPLTSTFSFQSDPESIACRWSGRLAIAPRPAPAASRTPAPETDYPNKTTWRAGSQSRGRPENPCAAGAGRGPAQEPGSGEHSAEHSGALY